MKQLGRLVCNREEPRPLCAELQAQTRISIPLVCGFAVPIIPASMVSVSPASPFSQICPSINWHAQVFAC